MNDHLPILESAIADVGCWTWWASNLPGAFQVEFGGTQLWNPPISEGQAPSGVIALRFRKPRLVYFLTMSEGSSQNWPDQLQRDEMKPPRVRPESFTLTSIDFCGQIIAKAKTVQEFVGKVGSTALPMTGESIIGFEAGSFGVVIAAESLGVLNHQEELDEQGVLTSSRKWWSYWQEYWRRKDTSNPLPHDFACEVTIPAAPDA